MPERSKAQNILREIVNAIQTGNTASLTELIDQGVTLDGLLTFFNNLTVDEITQALAIIDTPHHEVHDGESFTCFAVDTAMADTETLIIAFRTGATEVHMVIDFDALVAGHIEVDEGATWDNASGAVITIQGRNRRNSEDSVIVGNQSGAWVAGQMVANPTNPVSVAIIDTIYAFGTKQIGVVPPRGMNEWILDINTTYIIRLVADGNNNAGFIRLNWYEETI
jgi:hypothetical protein